LRLSLKLIQQIRQTLPAMLRLMQKAQKDWAQSLSGGLVLSPDLLRQPFLILFKLDLEVA